jgi:hypothetical protein
MLRSHPSSVFVLKYYAPLLLFGGTFIFWNSRFRFGALVVLIPLFLGIFFTASLAVLRIPDGTVHYRHEGDSACEYRSRFQVHSQEYF